MGEWFLSRRDIVSLDESAGGRHPVVPAPQQPWLSSHESKARERREMSSSRVLKWDERMAV